MARRKQLFPLQSAEGNVIQSQQDSAVIWGNLCLSPGCPGPMFIAVSLAPLKLLGGMGFCMEVLVRRCCGSAQANLGGLVMGRVTLAEGITAVSHSGDMAGVGEPWWTCPTPQYAQPPAQERLSSCKDRSCVPHPGDRTPDQAQAPSKTHPVPKHPEALTWCTGGPGRAGCGHPAVRTLLRIPKSCNLQQNTNSGSAWDTLGTCVCPAQGGAVKLWQCHVPTKTCSPGQAGVMHLPVFPAASLGTWQH